MAVEDAVRHKSRNGMYTYIMCFKFLISIGVILTPSRYKDKAGNSKSSPQSHQ